MEKRTVTLRETAMKAVPSNREVTEAVLRLRDGSSERGTLITQERGMPIQCCRDTLATSLCTGAVFLAQTLGINELWVCIFFTARAAYSHYFFQILAAPGLFAVACGLSCPAAWDLNSLTRD